jgi:hypothetical protein
VPGLTSGTKRLLVAGAAKSTAATRIGICVRYSAAKPKDEQENQARSSRIEWERHGSRRDWERETWQKIGEPVCRAKSRAANTKAQAGFPPDSSPTNPSSISKPPVQIMKQHFTQTEERKANHGGQNLVGKNEP